MFSIDLRDGRRTDDNTEVSDTPFSVSYTTDTSRRGPDRLPDPSEDTRDTCGPWGAPRQKEGVEYLGRTAKCAPLRLPPNSPCREVPENTVQVY